MVEAGGFSETPRRSEQSENVYDLQTIRGLRSQAKTEQQFHDSIESFRDAFVRTINSLPMSRNERAMQDACSKLERLLHGLVITSGDFIEEGIPATTHEKVALHIKTAHDAIGDVKMSLEDQDIDGAVHHLMAQKNGAKTETLAAMNTLLDAIKLARTTDTDTNTSGFNN
jgi:hypothetical protein